MLQDTFRRRVQEAFDTFPHDENCIGGQEPCDCTHWERLATCVADAAIDAGFADSVDKAQEAFLAKLTAERPTATDPLTRFEVIDHRKDAPTVGRAFVAWPATIELSYQDTGRTLKVFVTDRAA
jgi:hypothetical protein